MHVYGPRASPNARPACVCVATPTPPLHSRVVVVLAEGPNWLWHYMHSLDLVNVVCTKWHVP